MAAAFVALLPSSALAQPASMGPWRASAGIANSPIVEKDASLGGVLPIERRF